MPARTFLLTMHLLVVSNAYTQKDTSFVLQLWANGAPGFENRRNEPEQSQDWWVKNIHSPSITVFQPAREKSNGTCILICPGGGHRALGYKSEGVEVAKYLNSLGITACVLKYRLFREEGSDYTIENVKQDAFRALRTIYSHSSDWRLDTAKIGMMGFSAGGEVVSWTVYESGKGNQSSIDLIDRIDVKPGFQILIYPGPLGIPDAVAADAPQAFLLAANDDVCCSGPIVELLEKYRKANASIEVHLFAKGDHAFNLGKRSSLKSIRAWPQFLAYWLADRGYINPAVELY